MTVSAKPSGDEVRKAIALLEEAVRDFPFSDVFSGDEPRPYKIGVADANGYRATNFKRGWSSRWNTYAAILHPQVRHLLPSGSSTPFYHLDKAVPGEGAGLLMNTVNIIATGRVMPIRVFNEKNPGEFEKGIPAALLSGDPAIGIDNMTGHIESDALAALATAGEWVARRYGKNDVELRIKTLAMWMMGGNNTRFNPDLVQRMVPIRLDSGLVNPAKERTARMSEFAREMS